MIERVQREYLGKRKSVQINVRNICKNRRVFKEKKKKNSKYRKS